MGGCGQGACGQGKMCCWRSMHAGKLVVMGVVGLAAVAWFVTGAAFNWAQKKQVGMLPLERHTITISADDKVVVKPDLAVVSIGLTTDAPRVSDAQSQNTKKFNDLLRTLKALGIAEKDIQTTQYNINPKYEWVNNSSKFSGYTVSQSVEVKIRDIAKASDVLDAAGQSGMNQVGGLDFRVDNADAYRDQAREKAVAKAKAKAEVMARQAGFSLGKIVNFSENSAMPYPMPTYRDSTFGLAAPAEAPKIEAGTQDIVSNVSLTYEIE